MEFKNIALSAAGDRSSVSGIRATIFGAGSRALGHQIVFRLGKKKLNFTCFAVYERKPRKLFPKWSVLTQMFFNPLTMSFETEATASRNHEQQN